MKRVLVIGSNSYIGSSFCSYINTNDPESLVIDTVSVRDDSWQDRDFSPYDAVLNCAGIAHIKETKENESLYYKVNRDLAIKLAQKSKESGVGQFVLLSSMSVYGLVEGSITKDTAAHPVNAYGRSKLEADEEIAGLVDDSFRFACLRPPMVYGKNCKGNYQALRRVALRSPFFPDCNNKRSMVYIGNLCEFLKDCICLEREGLFFPQNSSYVNTGLMVERIAQEHGKRIRLTKAFNKVISITPVNVVKKVFGSLTYELVDAVDKYGFEESIRLSEMP